MAAVTMTVMHQGLELLRLEEKRCTTVTFEVCVCVCGEWGGRSGVATVVEWCVVVECGKR